jgi:hypothetical protein
MNMANMKTADIKTDINANINVNTNNMNSMFDHRFTKEIIDEHVEHNYVTMNMPENNVAQQIKMFSDSYYKKRMKEEYHTSGWYDEFCKTIYLSAHEN